MKKITKISILLLMIISALFAFTACSQNIKEIKVDTANTCRVRYVQGQDLDLSGGKLSVTTDKGTKVVDLDSSDVQVSGYDKDTIGKQNLTVTYQGYTTQLEVTVIPRISVRNITDSYFIGETFDYEKGHFQIANDDASTFNVEPDDPNIKINGFDSSKEAELSLNVTYSGDGKNYTGNFNVKVYSVGDITFRKPNKSIYKSHEQNIDLAGSSLVLKSKDEKLSKTVKITEEMISGFDLSQATINNRTEAFKQTVQVTYDKVTPAITREFEISILFSDVSVIKQRIQELSSCDWTSSEPTINDNDKANAKEAMSLFVNLPEEEQELFEKDELLNLVRCAAVYVYNDYQEALKEYKDVFEVGKNTLTIIVDSKDEAEEAYNKLKDTENPLATQPLFILGKVLTYVVNNYSDYTLYGQVLIGDHIKQYYDSAKLNDVVNKLNLMFKLYDALKDVPDDWTTEELSTYAANFRTFKDLMNNSIYKDVHDRDLYKAVSSWRAKDDMFELAYTYFIAANDSNGLSVLLSRYLPGILNDYYTYCSDLSDELILLYTGQKVDTTSYMILHKEYEKVVAEVQESKSYIIRFIYSNAQFLTPALSQLLTMAGYQNSALSLNYIGWFLDQVGYYNFAINLCGDSVFEDYWDIYIDIYNKKANGEYATGENNYGNDIDALLDGYVNMTPSWQYGFICSLNPTYSYPIRQDPADPALNLFFDEDSNFDYVIWIKEYYKSKLTENAYDLFQDLLLASEYFSLRYMYNGGTTDFAQQMQIVDMTYKTLSSQDKNSFNQCKSVKNLYDKYIAIFNRTAGTAENLSEEWQAKFQELADSLFYVNVSRSLIQQQTNAHSMVIASIENAMNIVEEILNCKTSDVINSYLYDSYQIFSDAPDWSLEYQLFYFKQIYLSTMMQMVSFGDIRIPIWDIYSKSDMHDFLLAAYKPMAAFMAYQVTRTTDTFVCSEDEFIASLTAFNEMDDEAKYLFYAIDLIYANAKSLFLQNNLPQEALSVFNTFTTMEGNYLSYVITPEYSDRSTIYANLVNSLQELESALEKLQNKEAFEKYFGEIIEGYKSKIEEIHKDNGSHQEDNEG